MGSEKCSALANEAEAASKHSLDIASSIYEEAANCFDKEGNRRKSGQFLTLAGDILLEINKHDQAATCYGKAILRYLMSGDIETAQILINKGGEYGFSSANHHYRIAIDSLERRKEAKPETEDVRKEKIAEERIIEEESLPEVVIMPLDDEEQLITIEMDDILDEEDIQIKKQNFVIPQLEQEDPSRVGSFAVLAAVSRTTRELTRQHQESIQTNAVMQDASGETKILEPKVTMSPVKSAEDEKSEALRPSETTTTETTEVSPLENQDSLKSFLNEIPDLEHSDTLNFEYSGKTEIVNEYAEEIHNIEVVDTIPFQWQVIDIKSDFDLEKKHRTDEGLIYTWKKDMILPGRKLGVEYVLRKRVERSIVLRKKNQVSVLNLYHSVQKDLQAHMEFVNTTGNYFEEILVEDVIPPELVVVQAESAQNIKPITLPTHDSTLFRWIFSRLPPGETFSVKYLFREKPITRWYIHEIESEKGITKVEKISQPFVDSRQSEYIWMYRITNLISDEIQIEDRIPGDYEIALVEPSHLRPSLTKSGTHKVLSWKLSQESTDQVVLIRIYGSESFTPLAPEIRFPRFGKPQLVERETQSQRKVIDFRKIQEE
ncbi:MAG: hypothetical protein ACFFE8_07170 [Candidatus Heimdallarchaeota archaeon]